jgi:uncharacterized repeat protein (TIGR03803 family)
MKKRLSLVAPSVLAFVLALPATAQTYEYSILYSFQNNGTDPSQPTSLIIDAKGNLYGTSLYGGKFGKGSVFELSPKGVLTLLHSFNGTDGSGALSLTRDSHQGNLYGTAWLGNSAGTVFELIKTGATYKLSDLYQEPFAEPQTVTLDPSGNIYGTDIACTCIFEIPVGGHWTEIYDAGGQPTYPVGDLIIDKSGKLFGSIDYEGTGEFGWIVELEKRNSAIFMLPFSDPATGSDFLRQDLSGNIYGLAVGDGTFDYGMVYELDPGTGVFTTIYAFTGGSDGENPVGSFSLDSAGNVFGTAGGGPAGGGLVFKVTASGNESVLYTFADESYHVGLLMDGQGNLYGTSAGGGADNMGYVYKLALKN